MDDDVVMIGAGIAECTRRTPESRSGSTAVLTTHRSNGKFSKPPLVLDLNQPGSLNEQVRW